MSSGMLAIRSNIRRENGIRRIRVGPRYMMANLKCVPSVWDGIPRELPDVPSSDTREQDKGYGTMHHDETLRKPSWGLGPADMDGGRTYRHTRRTCGTHEKDLRLSKRQESVNGRANRLVGKRSVNGTGRSVACLDIGSPWKKCAGQE